MTMMTNAPTLPPIVESTMSSGSVVEGISAVEGMDSAVPNFHVGVRTRVMLAFTGMMLVAAAALYFYGQLSPGV